MLEALIGLEAVVNKVDEYLKLAAYFVGSCALMLLLVGIWFASMIKWK